MNWILLFQKSKVNSLMDFEEFLARDSFTMKTCHMVHYCVAKSIIFSKFSYFPKYFYYQISHNTQIMFFWQKFWVDNTSMIEKTINITFNYDVFFPRTSKHVFLTMSFHHGPYVTFSTLIFCENHKYTLDEKIKFSPVNELNER